MKKGKDVQSLLKNKERIMMKYMVRNLKNLLRKVILMLIPRKEKGQLEIYKCKLGIHDWVTEHWWETRQKPRRARFSHKGGRKRAQYYNKYCTRTYCRICGKKKKRNEN